MNRILFSAALAVVFGHAVAAEAPPLAGQCLSCHGVDGRSQIPYVPIIHGQQPEYLRHAMREYRDGGRTHGRAPVMGRYLHNLSDAEIDALADWFGEVRGETVGAVVGEYSAFPVTVAAATTAPVTGTDAPTPAEATDRVVYIDEDAGWQRLLAAEHNRDYFMLNSYVESEKFLTFCSIASMAAALNSLDIDRPLDPVRYPYPFFTQDNLFILANQQVRTFEDVVTEGLTLAEIGMFLEHLLVRPEVHFASDMTIDQMRAAVREGLDSREKRVIVNYDRVVLGQNGGGHVSPIGAYDAETDSVLVLDVARYKYPPAWVPFSVMFRSMQSVDTGSNRSRGIVVVKALR
jgi:cytochrome c553